MTNGRSHAVAVAARYYRHSVNALACLAIAAMASIMTVQVVYRYILGDSLIWAEEVTRYLLIWTTFLFAGPAYQWGHMASLGMLRGRLPTRLRAAVGLAGQALMLVLLSVLVYYGYQYASRSAAQSVPAYDFLMMSLNETGGASRLSIFWIYIAVPAGCLIFALHVVAAAAHDLRALATGAEGRQ